MHGSHAHTVSQPALKTSFVVPGQEEGGRYVMRVNIEPPDRGARKRQPDRLSSLSFCPVCTSAPNTAGAFAAGYAPQGSPSPGKSPKEKKKKSVKDSDLLKTQASKTSIRTHSGSLRRTPHHEQTAISTHSYIAVNLLSTLFIYDLSRSVEDPIDVSDFHHQPSCHDFNTLTATADSVELLIGFVTGDIAIWNPLTKKMLHRFNQDKALDNTSVCCVKWLPSKPNMFCVAFDSGCVYLYDRRLSDESPISKVDDKDAFSVHQHSKTKCNPVLKWCVSTRPITCMVFSPSGRYLAVSARDSVCYIIHMDGDKKLRARLVSSFGAALCCAWSPDEHYFVTGGEDDDLHIYDFRNDCLVARLCGHKSWVSDVIFDIWRCEKVSLALASGSVPSSSSSNTSPTTTTNNTVTIPPPNNNNLTGDAVPCTQSTNQNQGQPQGGGNAATSPTTSTPNSGGNPNGNSNFNNSTTVVNLNGSAQQSGIEKTLPHALSPTLLGTSQVHVDEADEVTALERYRIVSVGHDTRLLIWDFEPIPMEDEHATTNQVGSVLEDPLLDLSGVGAHHPFEQPNQSMPGSANSSPFAERDRSVASTINSNSPSLNIVSVNGTNTNNLSATTMTQLNNTQPTVAAGGCAVVKTFGVGVPLLDPICSVQIAHDVLCGVVVLKDGIIAVSASGVVQFWALTDTQNSGD